MYSTRFSALAAVFVVFSTPVLSETIDATGIGHGTSTATPMPVSEGLVVVHATSMYDRFETESPDNPFASASGPCFGAILIDKGAVSGDGLCRYTDGDGDVAVIKWIATGLSAEGRTQGDWMVMGGTGKWASITGGGTFDAGGESYTNKVSGELTRN
ncbi:hypothetical protein [Mameliella sediminis]|uniref:hypothetical protein n=1 Tax=Mameliella sediminis TaxID=2836866 RepID=UPI001C449873|nr:hypothetical protein [Mameliella sediminis]MBV7396063.1 hypothetical protein [Mameliella sediminis]MBY6115167.1 hypothetical protein [Antarctobacter heliothermus]MBY6144948.1 hypothetical protein [Mameliella alba]MCA0955974.1 hypothetical protein [Mameliella alba]